MEVRMSLILVLMLIVVALAFVGGLGASRGVFLGSRSKRRDRSDRGSIFHQQNKVPHIHLVKSIELEEKNEHLLILRLQENCANAGIVERHTSAPGISLDELRECIPWIPYDSKICLCCSAGFSSALIKRLKAMDINRDLYLVTDKEPWTQTPALRRAAGR
jgi:hypothetical protein